MENIGGETAVLVNIWYRGMKIRNETTPRSLPAGGMMALDCPMFERDAELVVAWRPLSHIDVCVFRRIKPYLDGGNAESIDLSAVRLPQFWDRRWIRPFSTGSIFRRDDIRLLRLHRQGRRLRSTDAALRRMAYETLNVEYRPARIFANTSSPASSDSPDTLWRNGSAADQASTAAGN